MLFASVETFVATRANLRVQLTRHCTEWPINIANQLQLWNYLRCFRWEVGGCVTATPADWVGAPCGGHWSAQIASFRGLFARSHPTLKHFCKPIHERKLASSSAITHIICFLNEAKLRVFIKMKILSNIEIKVHCHTAENGPKGAGPLESPIPPC